MPQQINLHHPLLLAPRRHLQARTIAMALGLWVLALLALAGWTRWRTAALTDEFALASRQHAAQKAQLAQAQAARQAALGSPAALKEEAARLEVRLAERRHLLALLEGGDASRSPTVLLRELSEELPPPVWLTEIRWSPMGVELAGRTLQPEALQAWIARRGTPHALRVEQHAEPTATDPGRATARQVAGGWSFRWRQSAAGTLPTLSPAVSPAGVPAGAPHTAPVASPAAAPASAARAAASAAPTLAMKGNP
jgi:Tfp pilus assembly protein PilN